MVACQALRNLLVAGLQPAVLVFVGVLDDVTDDGLQECYRLGYPLLVAAGFLP